MSSNEANEAIDPSLLSPTAPEDSASTDGQTDVSVLRVFFNKTLLYTFINESCFLLSIVCPAFSVCV